MMSICLSPNNEYVLQMGSEWSYEIKDGKYNLLIVHSFVDEVTKIAIKLRDLVKKGKILLFENSIRFDIEAVQWWKNRISIVTIETAEPGGSRLKRNHSSYCIKTTSICFKMSSEKVLAEAIELARSDTPLGDGVKRVHLYNSSVYFIYFEGEWGEVILHDNSSVGARYNCAYKVA